MSHHTPRMLANDSYLAKVAHGTEVLYIQVITSVWHHHLRACLCQCIDDVSCQEPCCAKDCSCDATNLHADEN